MLAINLGLIIFLLALPKAESVSHASEVERREDGAAYEAYGNLLTEKTNWDFFIRFIGRMDDGLNRTLLHWGAHFGATKFCKHLLQGRDSEKHRRLLFAATTTEAETPLHWAVLKKQPALVVMFIRYGADLEATRFDGRTALSLAPDVETASLLVQLGANYLHRDLHGERPIDLAVKYLRRDLYVYLAALMGYSATSCPSGYSAISFDATSPQEAANNMVMYPYYCLKNGTSVAAELPTSHLSTPVIQSRNQPSTTIALPRNDSSLTAEPPTTTTTTTSTTVQQIIQSISTTKEPSTPLSSKSVFQSMHAVRSDGAGYSVCLPPDGNNCNCPSGTSDYVVANPKTDVDNSTFVIHLCLSTGVTYDPTGSFGGVYFQCDLKVTQFDAVNPLTNAWSCPSDFPNPITFRSVSPLIVRAISEQQARGLAPFVGCTMSICFQWMANSRLGGFYQKFIEGSSAGGKNPVANAVTGDFSCPSGYSAIWFGATNAPEDAGNRVMYLYYCLRNNNAATCMPDGYYCGNVCGLCCTSGSQGRCCVRNGGRADSNDNCCSKYRNVGGVCQPATSCGNPPGLDNGWVVSGNSNIGASRDLGCDRSRGYHLIGASTLTCQRDGTWSQLGYCRERTRTSSDSCCSVFSGTCCCEREDGSVFEGGPWTLRRNDKCVWRGNAQCRDIGWRC